ncbi:DUF4350 domain-containing protein [Paenarthrobacter sp. NPDC089322]|uniref:DUF4350 domain-containing protein n=1 Tax=Paenarthrobacter sp. NPDC089322 TaxID=3155065 RepID=UPI003419829A
MTLGAETREPEAPPARASGFRSWFRRHLTWIGIGLLFAALATFLVVNRFSAPDDARPLSAHNPAPDGGMAVAEILRARGVAVTATDSHQETLAELAGSGDTTLLLYDPKGFLAGQQLEDLKKAANRVVVVAPRLRTLTGLDEDLRPGGVVPEATNVLEPGCADEDAEAAGPVSAQGPVYIGPGVCYPTRSDGPGLYAASEDGNVIVLGSQELLDNEHLDDEGNAALAFRTLGSTSELIWYLPGATDIAADRSAPTLNELAPAWLAFVGPWLAFVAILAIVWRGRRLGPLVFEPLPVVVQAAETAEGRARLYQDSRAVQRAADNLRAGALARLARHFNLGADATAESIVDAVARHSTRPSPELRTLLLDVTPQTEGHLVQWAQQMERIEQEATAR